MEPELCTSERKAEFLLNNAADPQEYRWAVREALRLGVDSTRLEESIRDREWQNPSLYLPHVGK